MSSCERMTDEEVARLALAICATAETLGYILSAEAAELMAEDLAEYPKEHVVAALKACRRELKGKLTTREILDRVHAVDGRPDSEEAWAIALTASDEANSVMLTEEISGALVIASPVLRAGDKVGGRKAFQSAYVRLVDEARRAAQPAAWRLSMGHDPQLRVRAIEEAVRSGLLPAPEANKYLEQLAHEPIAQDGRAIAGLLTGSAAEPSPAMRERWLQLREAITRARDAAREKRAREAQERREKFEVERARQLRAAAERMSGGSVHG